MNYYKFNIGDYAAATRHLLMIEHGAYRLLLDLYYTTEQPIPADLKAAARKAGARSKEEVAAVEVVLPEFFTLTDAGWMHARCETEIAAYHQKAESNRVVGARGGRPKKKPNAPESGNPEITQMVSEINPQETLTKNQEPRTNNQEEIHSSSSLCSTPRAVRGDDDKPVSPAEWLEVFADQHGVDVDHRSFHDRKKFWPLATAWTSAGVTVGQMRQACAKAFATATEPIAWLPAYADRVLASMQAPARDGRQSAEPLRSFAEVDRDAGMQRWEQMTGRIHPDRIQPGGHTLATRPTFDAIDATYPTTTEGGRHGLAIESH